MVHYCTALQRTQTNSASTYRMWSSSHTSASKHQYHFLIPPLTNTNTQMSPFNSPPTSTLSLAPELQVIILELATRNELSSWSSLNLQPRFILQPLFLLLISTMKEFCLSLRPCTWVSFVKAGTRGERFVELRGWRECWRRGSAVSSLRSGGWGV